MTLTELSPRQPAGTVTDRWLPSRAGILNVWRYHDEEFQFDHGRLLLRGPNGSGKSKALEVLLPFLFDANLRPNRLSTFGTSERTMHWNLMGDRYDGATRVGYVWLEFGGPDGWFTCGARLQASRHTTTTTTDYFTTTKRIGQDLALLDEDHAPITRAALVAAIGTDGVVYDSAGDYRTAVRRALFPGLSEQRYDALISALLQLRTPKLSERLDPGLVSDLLSRALPPLGQQEVAELAEGFERLDRQREQLKRLDDYVEAAAGLAARATTYARRVLRSAAQALIGATSTMDSLTRAARESEQSHVQARTDLTALDGARTAAVAQMTDDNARIEALRDSDVYKEGKQIDLLREQVRVATADAREHTIVAERRRAAADVAERETDSAGRAAEVAVVALRDEYERTSAHAERVGLVAVVGQTHDLLSESPGRARSVLQAAVQTRLGQIRTVRQVLRDHSAAVRDRTRAESALEAAAEARQLAETTLDAARTALYAAADEQVERLRGWLAALRELTVTDHDGILDHATDRRAVDATVSTAATMAYEAIAVAETTEGGALARLRDERSDVDQELRERRERRAVGPDAPYTRTADRTGRAGAPLWRLVRFAPDLDVETEAGLEAALQASGLLDAWVGPDGVVTVDAGHDIFVVAAATAAGRTLADVLVGEEGTDVPAAVLAGVLGSIAYGPTRPADAAAAVGADGSWQLASLAGSWTKPEPEYVGATAREQARIRRVAVLERRLQELDDQLEAVAQRLADLLRRRRSIQADLDALPSWEPLDAAGLELRRSEARLGAAGDRVAQTTAELRSAEGSVDEALRALTLAATGAALPADPDALDRFAEALDGFGAATAGWFDAHQTSAAAAEMLRYRLETATENGLVASEAESTATHAEAAAREVTVRLATTEEAVGAPYNEVLERLARLRAAVEQTEAEVRRLSEQVEGARERIGALEDRMHTDAERRDEAVGERDSAAERFRRLARSTLAEDAGAEVEDLDGVRATLDAARSVSAASSAPYAAKDVNNALATLTEELHGARQILAERAELELRTEADLSILSAQVDGLRVGAVGLVRVLRAERERGQSDITAAERELFDQTLTGDTRRHLAERIRQAVGLVDRMNANLQLVRTASDVAVKLVWQVDHALPDGTREARELLLKDPVRLSPEDREALHRFFRDRIDEARSANTAATWEQQLSEVFDYTTWHQFVVKVDRANGDGWQDLTKRLHGALSGGEKAIALHLPLFAAVAAHYESEPRAPRLILLDEVFVGVDSSNRGQVFGLLTALDLDLVLTSDHEWCTYRELPGIAVHQLLGEDDVVTTARFVWSGSELLSTDDSEPVWVE